MSRSIALVKGRLRVAHAMAMSLALIAACTADTAPPPKAISAPTPTNAMVHSTAATLMLHLGDLPAGYRLQDDARITLESLSGGTDRGITREQAMRGGFVDGQRRSFVLNADTAGADRAAFVYLYVLKDPASASDALEQAVPKDPSFGRVAIGETIGDNSHGYHLSQQTQDGMTLDALIVEFQYGNTLTYVLLQGPTGAPTVREASAIAKKQLAALQADAVGPALSTPAPRTKPVPAVFSDLGLQLADLPRGFTQTEDVSLSVDDLSSDELGEQFFRDITFRGAWGRVFTSADQKTTATSVVLLCSAAQAERALADIVKNATDTNIYAISTGVTVGDESYAVEAHGGGTTPMTYRSLYFRLADAVGWVIVRGPTGAYDASFVTDLGRKLIAHLD